MSTTDNEIELPEIETTPDASELAAAEALAAIERIGGWKIADGPEIDAAPRYTVTLRFRLDLAQLPRPVQIGALGQEDAGLDASRSVRLNPEPAR
jgi:hypothetical protein